MIQELISTSAPRCLDGNAGYGIVAQTVGMAPNVSMAVNALSGYTHVAAPGSANNPVVYLHAHRRTGGMLRHVVSRVADCGNDYTGRSNRIAHHWIVEEGDTRNLPGGPAEMATFLVERKVFRSQWNEKPTELPPKPMTSHNFPPKKCEVWERLTGDAGWGGVVAEHAERGDPVSLIFTPEHNSNDLLALIGEALALLPPSVRWGITFSTYYLKSQELSGDKIQIRCFLVGSAEATFVKQSPNTLLIDLRQRLGTAPAGKYVELAHGNVKPDGKIPAAVVPIPLAVPGTSDLPSSVPLASVLRKFRPDYSGGRTYATTDERGTDWTTVIWASITLVVIALILGGLLPYKSVSPWLAKEPAEVREPATASPEEFQSEPQSLDCDVDEINTRGLQSTASTPQSKDCGSVNPPDEDTDFGAQENKPMETTQ